MNEQVIALCQLRNKTRALMKENEEDRVERLDGERTLANLLAKQMMNHSLERVQIDEGSCVHLVRSTCHTKPIRTVQDVCELVRGAGQSLINTPIDQLERQLVSYVKARIGETKTTRQFEHPRVCVVKVTKRKPGVPLGLVDSSVQRLVGQYTAARDDVREMRALIRPLREQTRIMTKNLLDRSEVGTTFKVQAMSRESKPQTLKISCVEGTRKNIGIQKTLMATRECARKLALELPGRRLTASVIDECISKHITDYLENIPLCNAPRVAFKRVKQENLQTS
jgi:hypothetical protein